MNKIIDKMLKKYNANTLEEKKNALKEIIQEIVLCGLSRTNFFDNAAFYGGTALRIFYGLDRFSEDLDFSLIKKDESFDLSSYFPMLSKEVEAYGLKLKIELKEKSANSNIQSAFSKGDTKQHMLYFYKDSDFSSGIPNGELLKIKFEIDISPPLLASFEHKYALTPTPHEVNLYDLPSLFSGKIAAVLCRGWKHRIKGRDLYDYVFFLQNDAAVNLDHLKQRLVQANAFNEKADLTLDKLKEMLNAKFDSLDYENAKKDVVDFIKDKHCLDIWSKDFFKEITKKLKANN